MDRELPVYIDNIEQEIDSLNYQVIDLKKDLEEKKDFLEKLKNLEQPSSKELVLNIFNYVSFKLKCFNVFYHDGGFKIIFEIKEGFYLSALQIEIVKIVFENMYKKHKNDNPYHGFIEEEMKKNNQPYNCYVSNFSLECEFLGKFKTLECN